jgi:hypothetical protein
MFKQKIETHANKISKTFEMILFGKFFPGMNWAAALPGFMRAGLAARLAAGIAYSSALMARTSSSLRRLPEFRAG